MQTFDSYTVHIAGEMIDGIQRCTRCGLVLINYLGTMVAVMPGEPMPCMRGWPVSGFIAQRGNQSILLDHDAREADELRCDAAIQ